MRAIVLAAGEGYQLDGFCKLLIRDPESGQRIIEKYCEAFQGMRITVVVGYQAISIMNEYPDFDYVYNPNWRVTNNSYSLAMALTDEPSFVVSSDFIFEPELIQFMLDGPPDCVLTEGRENRALSAINCVVKENAIRETYQGALRSINDPEAIGVYKISSPELLRAWNANCRGHGNLFVGLNLPLYDDRPIHALDKEEHRFYEVNTPQDYINLLSESSGE